MKTDYARRENTLSEWAGNAIVFAVFAAMCIDWEPLLMRIIP